MKKRFLTLILTMLAASLFAQAALDPNDAFYKDAKNWETKRIISWLPQMKPYPAKTIKSILNAVKEKGDESDVALADYYMNKFFSKAWNVGFTIGDSSRLSNSENTRNLVYGEPILYGDLEFLKIVSLSYKLGVFVQNRSLLEDDVCPMFKFRLTDTHDDPALVGPFKGNIDMASNVSVGTDKLYGTLGLNRIAYGPFVSDSVLLNGKQFHSGNFLFNYDSDKWGYTQTVSIISRSPFNGDSNNGDFRPEKFLSFHSVRLTPCKWFAFSFFEGSVYTNRFDPSYFIPVPFMVIQCMYGAADNLITGLTFDFRPIDRLAVSVTGVIDDIDVNGLSSGDWGTRLKMALMAGINYVPSVKFIDNLSFDYTLVTPYTYSHSDPQISDFGKDRAPQFYSQYNKDNFTTRLQSLGTSVPPNSDRFQFAVNFTPVERLRIGFDTSFVRHANIAESFSNAEARAYIDANTAIKGVPENNRANFSTDGSIWTSPMYPDQSKYQCTPSASRNFFLSQEHKMYILQCGLAAQYELPRYKWGTVSFNAGYMFEYVYNKGVDSNIYVAKADGTDATDADVALQKENWAKKFYNQFNNYFMISVTYRY